LTTDLSTTAGADEKAELATPPTSPPKTETGTSGTTAEAGVVVVPELASWPFSFPSAALLLVNEYMVGLVSSMAPGTPRTPLLGVNENRRPFLPALSGLVRAGAGVVTLSWCGAGAPEGEESSGADWCDRCFFSLVALRLSCRGAGAAIVPLLGTHGTTAPNVFAVPASALLSPGRLNPEKPLSLEGVSAGVGAGAVEVVHPQESEAPAPKLKPLDKPPGATTPKPPEPEPPRPHDVPPEAVTAERGLGLGAPAKGGSVDLVTPWWTNVEDPKFEDAPAGAGAG